MDEIEQRIINLLKEKKGDVVISEDTSVKLLDTGVIDSFDIVELIGYLEEIFKIEIDGEDIVPENFETVDSIAKFVKKYR